MDYETERFGACLMLGLSTVMCNVLHLLHGNITILEGVGQTVGVAMAIGLMYLCKDLTERYLRL